MKFWIGSQDSGMGNDFPNVTKTFGERLSTAFASAECGEVDGVLIMFYQTSTFYEGVRPWVRKIRRSYTAKDILGRKIDFFNCFIDVGVKIADGEILSRTGPDQYRFVGESVASLLEHVFGRLNAGNRDAARLIVLSVKDQPY